MRPVLILLAGLSAGFQPSSAQAQRKEINLSVVMQQTPAWCWAATASMALRLLDFPDINPAKNYQCGVVAAAFDNCQDDCTKCVTSLGSMQSLVGVLNRYRDLSLDFDPAPSVDFSPNYVAYPAWTRIKRSLDVSYPVIAGISPDEAPTDPAKSEHTVLITGYEDDRSGERLGHREGPLSVRPRKAPPRMRLCI